MSETAIQCPYCGGWLTQESTICPDCHEDLAALVRLALEHAIFYNDALALAREGHLEEARARLLLSLERNGRFLSAQRLLTKVAAAQGDWLLARRSAARALDLAPDDALVRRLAAEVEAEAQRHARSEGRATPSPGPPAEPARPGQVSEAVGHGVGVTAFLGAIFPWLTGKEERR